MVKTHSHCPFEPALAKQRYGTELRSKTLASLKPEIFLALDSLLEEIHSTADTKVLRTTASSCSDSHRLALRKSRLHSYGFLPSDYN